MALSKCPRCGFNDVIEKKVDKLLRGGDDAAVVNILADVCLHCGEQMYPPNTAHRLDHIRRKLGKGEVEDFQPIGRYFRVPDSLADEEDSEKVRLPTKLSDPYPGTGC